MQIAEHINGQCRLAHGRVSSNASRDCHKCLNVLPDPRDNGRESLDGHVGDTQAVHGNRHQLFAEFCAELMEAVLGLVELGLYRVVLHGIFVVDRHRILVRLVSQLLHVLDIPNLVREDREHVSRARPVQPHLLKHRGKLAESTHLLKALQEYNQGLVSVLTQECREGFDILPSNLGELGRFLIHLAQEVGEGRGRSLRVLHVHVEHRSVSHNLSLRELDHLGRTRHARTEVFQVPRRSRRALGQLVHGGGRREHGLFEPEMLVLSEEHGKLADILDRVLPEVVAQRHIDSVRGLDEVENLVCRRYSQLARLPGQSVELLDGCTCVNLREELVDEVHLLLGQARVLLDLCFRLLYRCEIFHSL